MLRLYISLIGISMGKCGLCQSRFRCVFHACKQHFVWLLDFWASEPVERARHYVTVVCKTDLLALMRDFSVAQSTHSVLLAKHVVVVVQLLLAGLRLQVKLKVILRLEYFVGERTCDLAL